MTRLGPQDLTQVGPITATTTAPISTLQPPNDRSYGQIYLVIKLEAEISAASTLFGNTI